MLNSVFRCITNDILTTVKVTQLSSRSFCKFIPKKNVQKKQSKPSSSSSQSSSFQRQHSKKSRIMHRQWEQISNVCDQEDVQSFKLLSYNILAQDLLVEHLHLYLEIDTAHLRWQHRLQRLKKEILYLKPDILCLQEMQYNHLKVFVQQIRDHRQLEYIFKKKTGYRTDGCAIIYDREKFKLIDNGSVEYFNENITLSNRDNIGIMAKFQLRNEPTKDFIVATTHLLYNPQRDDVRMAQVRLLMNALNEFSLLANESQNNGEATRLPIILTGDFNSEPYTPPFMLLTTPFKFQHSTIKIQDVAENGEKNASASSTNNTPAGEKTTATKTAQNSPSLPISYDLEFCAINFGSTNASTLQRQWITVDYILHSIPKDHYKKAIQVASIYKLPTIDSCKSFGPIPNNYFGSDHYSLAIEFSVF